MSFAVQHPWMTFWLVVLGLIVLDNAVGNICQAIKSGKPK